MGQLICFYKLPRHLIKSGILSHVKLTANFLPAHPGWQRVAPEENLEWPFPPDLTSTAACPLLLLLPNQRGLKAWREYISCSGGPAFGDESWPTLNKSYIGKFEYVSYETWKQKSLFSKVFSWKGADTVPNQRVSHGFWVESSRDNVDLYFGAGGWGSWPGALTQFWISSAWCVCLLEPLVWDRALAFWSCFSEERQTKWDKVARHLFSVGTEWHCKIKWWRERVSRQPPETISAKVSEPHNLNTSQFCVFCEHIDLTVLCTASPRPPYFVCLLILAWKWFSVYLCFLTVKSLH